MRNTLYKSSRRDWTVSIKKTNIKNDMLRVPYRHVHYDFRIRKVFG